jgi:hypothetical protein
VRRALITAKYLSATRGIVTAPIYADPATQSLSWPIGFGIPIVKKKRGRTTPAAQRSKAADRRNTMLTTLGKARLLAGFIDWFNSVEISRH